MYLQYVQAPYETIIERKKCPNLLHFEEFSSFLVSSYKKLYEK